MASEFSGMAVSLSKMRFNKYLVPSPFDFRLLFAYSRRHPAARDNYAAEPDVGEEETCSRSRNASARSWIT